MPGDARFFAFLLVAAALIVAPGPDMALVTRNALRGGWSAVSRTAFGVAAGLTLWGAASAAGIATLLESSATAFTAVKFAGAAYLVFLGLRSLLAAARREQSAVPASTGSQRTAVSAPNRAFWEGLINNLLNPKAAVIFVSIFPQFVRPGDPPLRLAAMVLIFAGLTLAWLHGYGAAVARAGRQFGPGLRRALSGCAGAVMIGLGVRLAVERR